MEMKKYELFNYLKSKSKEDESHVNVKMELLQVKMKK